MTCLYREIAMHLGCSPQMAKKYVAQGLAVIADAACAAGLNL